MNLILKPEGDWIQLIGSLPIQITNFLKTSIKPISYRKYSPENKIWLIHWKKLSLFISFSKRYFNHIDWSNLPDNWQIIAATSNDIIIENQTYISNPFETLFLLENAPIEIIKSSYKTLAKMYHPDHGGSNEKMVLLNESYEQIRTLRKF